MRQTWLEKLRWIITLQMRFFLYLKQVEALKENEMDQDIEPSSKISNSLKL